MCQTKAHHVILKVACHILFDVCSNLAIEMLIIKCRGNLYVVCLNINTNNKYINFKKFVGQGRQLLIPGLQSLLS